MKSKKILWALLPLSAAMVLASCGGNPTPTPSSSEDSSGNHAEASSSQGDAPTPEPDVSSSEDNPVDHRAGLNKTLAEGALTRDFDERFDQKVEDFSGTALEGQSEASIHGGILREVVDSTLDSFPSTPGAAIFKMANATFGGDKTLLGQGSIHFKMRVAEGKLPLSDLIFALRPSNDSDAAVYPIKLSEAVNADSEANPELTDEFQDISIGIGDSIEDENTVFPGTELKVLSESIGFHLYVRSEANVSAVVEIQEVSFQKGDNKTVIDDFSRDTVSGNPNVYWGPTDMADSVLIRRGISLAKNQKYTTPALSEAAAGKTHAVFSVLGDLSDAKVSVTFDDEAATVKTIPFASLKGNEDAMANAVNGQYANLCFSLAQFEGPEGAKPKTIAIENTGDKEIQISKVFTTSFEVPDLKKAYPSINAKEAVAFDNFERTFTSLNGDYDASHSDSRNTEAGIYHFLSYSHGDKIYTKDGVLHLPGTEEGNVGDYDNVNIGSSHVLNGAQYIVFSIRAEEGADLGGFRFKTSDSGEAVWFNSALAMEGVKAYGDADYPTPYVTAEGFSWYVVDLAANGVAVSDSLQLYYTGVKDIEIDSIFYANSFAAYEDRGSAVTNAVDLDLSHYNYVGGTHVAFDSDYLAVTMKGDGAATFESFRVQFAGDTRYIRKDQLAVYDKAGRKISKDEIVPETETTYYFDLKDGFPSTMTDGWVHFHVGMDDKERVDGKDYGKLTVTRLGTAKAGVTATANAMTTLNFTTVGYSYVSGWVATLPAKRMYLHVSGDGTNDLSAFRIELKRNGQKLGEYWANALPLVKTIENETFDLNTKIDANGVDLVFDLAGAGMDVQTGDEVHFHINSIAEGSLTFGEATAACDSVPTSMALTEYSQSWAK